MANQGFGMGSGAPGAAEFGDLARQYWETWGRMMGAVQPPAPQPVAAWADPAAWWSAAIGPHPQAGSEPEATMRRYGEQASGWFAQMQHLASRFAGQDASAADIASAWRQMLAANPLVQGFGASVPGFGAGGSAWPSMAQALQSWQREAQAWLGLPAFGFAREHQERWQRLAAAQVEAQQATAAYNELMAQALQDAFGRFEKKLVARSEPGRQLESARALFDLWVEAAEEAYADSALSPRFREVYGAMVDAQMRVRGALQGEIEEVAGMLGLPTRTEVDAAHRRAVGLERELRRLRDAVEQLRAAAAQAGSATGTSTTGSGVDPEPGRTAPRQTTKGGASAAPRAQADRGATPTTTKTGRKRR